MAKKSAQPLFLPCTPKGIITLLHSTGIEIRGKRAVVLGRSDIVVSFFFLISKNEKKKEVMNSCLVIGHMYITCAYRKLF